MCQDDDDVSMSVLNRTTRGRLYLSTTSLLVKILPELGNLQVEEGVRGNMTPTWYMDVSGSWKDSKAFAIMPTSMPRQLQDN